MMQAALSTVMARELGGYRITPDWWRSQVREYLDEERGRQARMAKDLGVSPGTISELLSAGPPRRGRKKETSRLAGQIADWTGIPLGDKPPETVTELMSEAERVVAFSEVAVQSAISMLRAVRQEHERNQPPPDSIEGRGKSK